MTTEQQVPPDGEVFVEQPPITHEMPGSGTFSMIRGMLAFQPDSYYESAFNDSSRVRVIRDRMLGGHMVEEAEVAGAVPVQPPPATAYSDGHGGYQQGNVAPGTAPATQTPVAAPVQAQRGIPDGGQVPGEVHAVCGNTAVFKAPFTSKAGKPISGMLNCPVCKNAAGFQERVRWLNDDDPAWAVING